MEYALPLQAIETKHNIKLPLIPIVHSQMLQKRLLWNLIELKSRFNLENSRPDLHSLLDLLLVYHISLEYLEIYC